MTFEDPQYEDLWIRSKITNSTPGLTKGEKYKVIGHGFYQGGYITILNDRNQVISIYDAEKYLHTKDLKKKKK